MAKVTGKKTVLVLGGTGEAVALAEMLGAAGMTVITSLAGRTESPRLPAGAGQEVRRGGFCGAAGLADFLRGRKVHCVADATHPFAAQISAGAAEACERAGVARVVLARPPWRKVRGDDWREVDGHAGAAAALVQERAARHIFLSVGRSGLRHYLQLRGRRITARMIEPPKFAPPDYVRVVLSRGPFEKETEKKFLRDSEVDIVVSKNSGGDAAYPKIAAARELGLAVVMLSRPPAPPGPAFAGAAAAAQYIAGI